MLISCSHVVVLVQLGLPQFRSLKKRGMPPAKCSSEHMAPKVKKKKILELKILKPLFPFVQNMKSTLKK